MEIKVSFVNWSENDLETIHEAAERISAHSPWLASWFMDLASDERARRENNRDVSRLPLEAGWLESSLMTASPSDIGGVLVGATWGGLVFPWPHIGELCDQVAIVASAIAKNMLEELEQRRTIEELEREHNENL